VIARGEVTYYEAGGRGDSDKHISLLVACDVFSGWRRGSPRRRLSNVSPVGSPAATASAASMAAGGGGIGGGGGRNGNGASMLPWRGWPLRQSFPVTALTSAWKRRRRRAASLGAGEVAA